MQQFLKQLDQLLEDLPEMRRMLHEDLADLLKKEVDMAITHSGPKDSSGKIRRWQVKRVGSGGGYAAISAQKGEKGKNSPGAITNYLENGHKIRKPSGTQRRRGRIRKAYVNGFHFYKEAKRTVEPKAMRMAEKYVERFGRRVEGTG